MGKKEENPNDIQQNLPSLLVTKDELNLAEFPFCFLGKKPPKENFIYLEGERKTPSGELVKYTWKVEGGAKTGLPYGIDEQVYLGLMYFASLQNFESPKVEFKVGNLLDILGLGRGGKNYLLIENSLQRLAAAFVFSKDIVYNLQKETHETSYGFGIIDAFRLVRSNSQDEKSYFVFSEGLWSLISIGSLKSLDLEVYISLEGYITKRLYRYLDKKAYDGKKQFHIGLYKLAEEKLGMGTGQKNFHIKSKLKSAHEQLIEIGFLKSVTYRQGREDTIVCYTFGDKPPLMSNPLADKLIEHGLRPKVAMSLIRTYSEEPERIKHALEWFELYQKKSKKKAQNPAGLLFHAVEEGLQVEEVKSSSGIVRLIPAIPAEKGYILRDITEDEYSFLLDMIEPELIEQERAKILRRNTLFDKKMDAQQEKEYIDLRIRRLLAEEGLKRGLID